MIKPICLRFGSKATIQAMRNSRFVQITIWVVVIGMVLALLVGAISLF